MQTTSGTHKTGYFGVIQTTVVPEIQRVTTVNFTKYIIRVFL